MGPNCVLDQDLNVIRRCPLFGDLDAENVNRLLRHATTVEHGRGETLFTQGDPATHFFVIFEGWVKVYRLTRAGKEAVVGVFSKGQSFAEAAAFLQGAYPASAETVAECRLLRIPTGKLVAWVQDSPEIGLAMLASTSRHLHALVQQIEQLKARTGTQRVAEFLADLCPVDDGACTIGLPYDKALIAGRLGMKPESLSRAFARLRAVGVMIDHNMAAISDVGALRGYVDEEQTYFDSELDHG